MLFMYTRITQAVNSTNSCRYHMQRKSQPPLIIETHPEEYEGFPFITLIQFKTEHILCIVDNADDTYINAYVLDSCGSSGVDEQQLIEIAAEWDLRSRLKYPLSIEFSKRGITKMTQALYKTFPIEFVSRVIGPLPSYPMSEITKIRRRRKKQITGIEIKNVVKIF